MITVAIVWTQTRHDKMSGVILNQTVLHSDYFPEIISLVPNSVTTIFGFSPTGRRETTRITQDESNSFKIFSFVNVKYVL